MLTLNDGRSELWQWDTGRKLTVDADCSQVHFSNKIFGRSIDVNVVDGVAIIPDVLLQTDKDLNVWAFVGTAENGYTKISKTFKVNRRNKPADYVFTPPDQTSIEEIKEKIEYLESIQDPDAIKNAVDDYLANNPIMVKETDPTVPEWAKQPTPPDVKIPDKLPNPHSITFTGAVDASYDGSNPVEIKIPDSGGNVDQGGSGLSTTAKNLLITILRNGVYSTNQSENITALAAELGVTEEEEPDIPDVPVDPDEPVVVTYTVTSGLTNVESSNTSTIVNEGSNYTATLTAVDGYKIESVIVTMGGVDITSTAYADGVVAIASVTGNVIITASAVEMEPEENNGWVNGEAYEIEWTAGYKLSSSGENVENSSCSVSDYLPCYEVNRFEGTGLTSNYKYWFYDADKNFIGMSDVSMVYSGTGACARRGAYFVRVEAKTTNTSTATVTPYQDELLTECTVYEIGKNYRLKWTDGYYLDSNGHEIVGADHCVSDFAFCYGAVGITPGITERHFYYFYDADKNYISSYTYSNEKETIQIPANASYFRSFWPSTGFNQFVKLS